MPRHKVDPLSRRRVAQACESCKRRKEKCSGKVPCDQCVSRKRGIHCHYVTPQVLQNGSRQLLRETIGSNDNSDNDMHQALNALEDLAPSHVTKHSDIAFVNSAPLSQVSRILRDSRGKFIYVGESASQSFLQLVRKAMAAAVGPCEFSTDPSRHLMIETTPVVRFDKVSEPMLDLAEATALVRQYFLVASGILDLFDLTWLMDALPAWIGNPVRNEELNSPVFYLALAIGAQGRARDELDDSLAEQCFGYGRQLAMFTLMDNPSILTVQAFTMIAYYMIAACRRNGAFTNLGVAVRAAYALGIHRHETNIAFVTEEGLSRERAWKTLRVCDLFLSASMGRPPSTSEVDCNIPWASLQAISDRENSVSAQVSSAIFRICHVFERVLLEVYTSRAVSLELAGSISTQLREWTEELPEMLKIDGLDKPENLTRPGLSHRLGSSVVTMAYYYSIILLTRPFLTFKVCYSKKEQQGGAVSPSKANLKTYADACIDSAIKGIGLAYEVVFEPNMPRRQPLVINSVFISALCLGFAYLDDYDQRGWRLHQALDRGVEILSHFGRLNPQSAHYARISQLLQAAVTRYTDKRDNSVVESSSHLVRHMFGDVRNSRGEDAVAPARNEGRTRLDQIQQQAGSSTPNIAAAYKPMSPSSVNDNSLQQESMITTSGTLIGQFHMGASHQYHLEAGLGDLPHDFFLGTGTLPLNGYVFENDVPLFSLTDDISSRDHVWQ